MSKNTVFSLLVKTVVLVALVGSLFLTGCTKRPSKEELSALDEACAAAKAAEQRLEELRSERMALEGELETKKGELRELEEQRDAIRAKLEENAGETAK